MATILVYNLYTNRMERYTRAETDPMPYSYGRTLLVREFRGSSRSSVMWTTTTAMESWNITRRNWGSGIYVGYAYKRIWEGGHGLQSQHYAGTSFDTMQNQTSATRRRFHQLCQSLGVWTYVEPISMTPSWVHFDKRYGSPGRVPADQKWLGGRLRAGFTGRPERAGLHHPYSGRLLRRQHHQCAGSFSAGQRPERRRHLRLQYLAAHHQRGGGHRPHLYRDRLAPPALYKRRCAVVK